METFWKKEMHSGALIEFEPYSSGFVVWDLCEKNNSWDISHWKTKVECLSTGKSERFNVHIGLSFQSNPLNFKYIIQYFYLNWSQKFPGDWPVNWGWIL